MKAILVTDQQNAWEFLHEDIEIVCAADYLSCEQYSSITPLRVINLCHSYQYQSLGYYVSLLAEARGQRVIPSVLAIQDMKANILHTIIDTSLEEEMQRLLKPIQSTEFVLSVYFGKNMAERYAAFCRRVYGLFPMPLFRIHFKYRKNWSIKSIKPISPIDIPDSHRPFIADVASEYFSKKRNYTSRKKIFHYDMAILINPNEKTPPSDVKALNKFMDAGNSLDIKMELIEKEDLKFLNEYDALFIRETTSVNHYTYQFSRRAMAESLVVIDDPISILKCTNKVYLAELLTKHKIPMPRTTILSKFKWDQNINLVTYPCVLKRPDSSFSQGVIKVADNDEMLDVLKDMFKSSDLVIAQDFTPSEFDWRVGVFDHQPLYACRYYMAKGHWQIYNWDSRDEHIGNIDTIPLSDVPNAVIKTALKATKLIGNGLYGVDLKQIASEVFVIEVNDNPSIEHGVEDSLMGDDLYHQVMAIFLQRMKHKHGYN
jgi:glutathione synthase/RimK-type ligase-like ATP-grasp enzyme